MLDAPIGITGRVVEQLNGQQVQLSAAIHHRLSPVLRVHLKWILIIFHILSTQVYLLDILHDIIKSILRVNLNDG